MYSVLALVPYYTRRDSVLYRRYKVDLLSGGGAVQRDGPAPLCIYRRGPSYVTAALVGEGNPEFLA